MAAGIAAELAYMALWASEQVTTQGRRAAITHALGRSPLLGRQWVGTREPREMLLKDGLDGCSHVYI
jgi:hypothetical protein